MANLPKIALGAWAWGNDGTFGNEHKTEDLRVTIVGKNTDGFELSFSADDAVTLEPTFTCSAMTGGVLAEIKSGTSV